MTGRGSGAVGADCVAGAGRERVRLTPWWRVGALAVASIAGWACSAGGGEPEQQIPGSTPVATSDVPGDAVPTDPGAQVPGPVGETVLPDIVLDPGRTVLRRLNKAEYNNTVRDLLGTALRPADGFPLDQSSDGFDTVGRALGFSALHAEQFEAAATALVDELFALPVGDARRSSVLLCELAAGAEAECAQTILSGFARRAFRRPVAETEVTGLVGLIDTLVSAGFTYQEGLGAALRAVLLSADFIYRVEEGADPASTEPFALDSYDLAARLSYFLWSSIPDAALDGAANSGVLAQDPAELGRQTLRLLGDVKARAFVENFAGQWLNLRTVAQVAADAATFPQFDAALRDSAAEETRLFFDTLVRENQPLESFLLADFTVANARLAMHYGLASSGADFARVSFAGLARVGMLTQASFLMLTSLPHRTSPVKRGAWVLDRLLCSPPPPVPANLDIPMLNEPVPGSGATLRQTQEAHRADPVCASCHRLMDPIGLGLENYDAIGQYRTLDNGGPVDSAGILPDGTPFSGATELAPLLAGDPRFASCVTRRLLTFGVGRTFDTFEAVEYARAVSLHALADGRGSWQDWIENIVMSAAFTTGRGEAL